MLEYRILTLAVALCCDVIRSHTMAFFLLICTRHHGYLFIYYKNRTRSTNMT